MGKKTVLYDEHIKLGAKIVEFGGWDMPVQYSGIIDEHKTVRAAAGLFDVSHMGQIFVSGKDSLAFLQKVVPQDISKLQLSKAVYCQLPYENAGLVDDLIIYNLGSDKYLIIANAANIEKDYNWFKTNSYEFDVLLENKSAEYSMLALQGQKASDILSAAGISDIEQPEFFSIKKSILNNVPILLSRTGYTGEDGFEIILQNDHVVNIWCLLLEVGQKYGLKPIGLGARDTLRLEAALMLYGNDLDETTTPIEAGLKWSVPQNKECDYNGKSIIINQIKNGTSRKLVGFEMIDRAIPRHEYEIFKDGHKIGIVTSGGYSPTLDKNIGMGYVDTKDDINIDSVIQIMVRNKLYNAKVVNRPFVKKRYKNS